jgi:predicted nucleic acid-binding protein
LASDESRPWLVDTSVAIAFAVQDHEHHRSTFDSLAERDLGLSGHAAFETFSVLTRLPPPIRLSTAATQRLLTTNFPYTRFLSARRAAALLGRLAEIGVAGGAVYDALVGAAALDHGCTLVTRDRRAMETYRRLGVSVEMLG